MKKYITITAILLLIFSLTSCTDKSDAVNNTTDFGDAAKLLTEVNTTQSFTDEKIADADVEKILSAGVNAPSAMNTQPWHFTAVTDEDTNQKLANAMGGMMPPSMPEGMDGKEFPSDLEGIDGQDFPVFPEGMSKEDFPAMPEGMDKENFPETPEGLEGQQPPSDAPDFSKGEGFSRASDKAGIGDAPLTIVISCKEGSELDAGLAIQNMSAEAQLLGYGTKIMTAPTMSLNNDEYMELLSIPEEQKIVAVLLVGKDSTDDNTSDTVTSATTRNDFNEVVTIISR